MKRKSLLQLFAWGLFLNLWGCQVSGTGAEEGVLSEGQWLAYAEVQCGNNPWGYCNNTPDTKVCVKKYVQDQGFTVAEITLTVEEGLITCAACHCPTGRTFKVKVMEPDVAKLVAAGFKKI
ncbi:hypothetical protein ACD591_07130 [Rufibacter glacialis]|uniref:Lipoprotein n=1 Tax=Rufibacter glacialis TaxID=1259555 RepID=A0A5M8QG94_9BACT|nr:hypothetical protein [Rufibacter glacialis]KAA6433422.1 hypothetical protein FOE74_13180 [Rufibacter glacialis]GGK74367.1 hypothetical protein GCM10011405_23000 [Rufibacter glacialis]